MNVLSFVASPKFGATSDGLENKRESAAEIRASVYARIVLHGQTIREAGRAMGLSDRTVTDLLLEESERLKQRAIRLAWDNGRRSTLPPLNAMRRAA